MKALLEHIVKPAIAHPEALEIQSVEGEAATIFELKVHADDKSTLLDDDERTLRAVRLLVSAASGRRKSTVELVDELSDLSATEDDPSEDVEDGADEGHDDA